MAIGWVCWRFVFCIGAAMSRSFTSPRAMARGKATATKHAVRRFLLMGLIGLFIKNGDLKAFGGGGAMFDAA